MSVEIDRGLGGLHKHILSNQQQFDIQFDTQILPPLLAQTPFPEEDNAIPLHSPHNLYNLLPILLRIPPLSSPLASRLLPSRLPPQRPKGAQTPTRSFTSLQHPLHNQAVRKLSRTPPNPLRHPHRRRRFLQRGRPEANYQLAHGPQRKAGSGEGTSESGQARAQL